VYPYSIHLHEYPCVSICMCMRVSIYQCIRVCPSSCLSACVHLPVYPRVSTHHLTICIHLPVYPRVHPSLYPCVSI
jgi:hypothetical protein